MIVLFTGSPGAGKTAALVDLLRGIQDRPLFVDGLDGLTLDHTPTDATKWHTELPDGAVLVIDECQRVWRPGHSSKIPTPDITELETHRHRGIDIYLTTQSPSFLHSNVRRLVSRHIHIRDLGIMGRWWYEWPETVDEPQKVWKTAPVKVKYNLPKTAFSLYKSASLHTKIPRKISPMLVFAVVLILALLIFGARSLGLFSHLGSRGDQVKASSSGTTGDVRGVSSSRSVADTSPSFWKPAVSGQPWTAPAYASLRVVRSMPRVIGGYCVQSENGLLHCNCYTQQGTVAEMTESQCNSWHQRRPFNPYLADASTADNQRDREHQPNDAAGAPAPASSAAATLALSSVGPGM